MLQSKDSLTNGNGHHSNGKSSQNGVESPPIPREESQSPANWLSPSLTSEQAVVLRQSPIWSRGITWGIIGVTTAAVIWAAIAKIEQVVPARGQLKPQGTVKEIQAPVNGVVEEVMVEDGEHVKKGQVLVKLDSTASAAELASLRKVRQSVRQESEFYRTVMQQPLDLSQVERAIAQLKIPREIATLVRNRSILMEENRLFRLQLGNSIQKENLTAEQLSRLRAAQIEQDSRAAAARLEISQLQKQLQQAQVQLADARLQLIKDRQVLAEIKGRNEQAMVEATKALAIDRDILASVEPLLEEGALAKLQVERQRQSIYERQQQMIEQQANGKVEYEKQNQQIQTRLAEIERLEKEDQRLNFAISQAREQLTNTVSLSEKDVRDKMAANDKAIADIDSQLTKILVQNDQRIAELDSQISSTQLTLKYQELRSPVAGTVFDMQAAPGFVPKTVQAEPLLKIVPDDYLIAEVDITNEDIGFVRTGMKADVRIDSFPFSEFGDIKGQVTWIGSDALEPDEIHRVYRFPAKIELDSQVLKADKREIPLQSGMSVSANIKVREDRTVLSLFTELFTKKMESLKQVR